MKITYDSTKFREIRSEVIKDILENYSSDIIIDFDPKRVTNMYKFIVNNLIYILELKNKYITLEKEYTFNSNFDFETKIDLSSDSKELIEEIKIQITLFKNFLAEIKLDELKTSLKQIYEQPIIKALDQLFVLL